MIKQSYIELYCQDAKLPEGRIFWALILFLFKIYYLFVWKSELQREREEGGGGEERESSICWFTLQKCAMTGDEPGQNQEPEAPSESSMWWQALGPFFRWSSQDTNVTCSVTPAASWSSFLNSSTLCGAPVHGCLCKLQWALAAC